ncbi:TetR/AcrR family transcriptional regulator [Actinophytocola sediminis]
MTRTNYHHGALREALLTATIELIESDGIGAVSLRRVARAAGVSPGAPYHHFADRAALLAALSDEGYRRLAIALRDARGAAATLDRALAAIVEEYVLFASRHPAYFQVMFRPELKTSHKSQQDAEFGTDAFAVLEGTVDECITAGVLKPVDRDVLTLMLWSLVHGLASLWLDGQLADRTDDPEALTRQVANLVAAYMTHPEP